MRRGLLGGLVALACLAVALPAFAYASRTAHTVTIPGGNKATFRSATAKCPSGQHVLFGGFRNAVAGMQKTATDRWRVDGFNLGDQPFDITSYAYCGKGPIPTKSTHTVSIRSSATASARCPAGTVVVGAGFATRANTVLAVTQLERVGTEQVSVSAYLRFGITKSSTLTAIAYCGPGPAPTLASHTKTISNKGGHSRASCPAGTTLVFGGVSATASSSAMPLVLEMRATDKTSWTVADATAGKLTALAYCR
jgi:hypothetical protein